MSRALLVVVGPTASGKTELAVRLAETLEGEVISADSVQVYREFDIGTGKPSAEERSRAPHHLIDVIGPLEPMDAARFATLADDKIREISARGRRVIVCGGTFLWVRALLRGLAPAPPADPAIRAAHRARAEVEGSAALHGELAKVDPQSAARLHPNDFVRVSRALEVFELTGTPLSQWQAQHGFRAQRHAHRLLGIRHDPDALDARIAARLDRMLEAGWVREVEDLMARGFGAARAMRSVGYRQIHEAVLSGDTRGLRDRIYRATRVFARRQRTWLRDQPVEWLTPERAFSGSLTDLG